jgi:hypothetical protein
MDLGESTLSDFSNMENKLVQVPTEALVERTRNLLDRAAKVEGDSPLLKYARESSTFEDWDIVEQAPYTLPFSITSLITLNLRDEGNALIEETRQLNNSYIGATFRTVDALLLSDLELLDLKDRALDWGAKLCNEVLYRVRHKIKDDPFGSYQNLFNSCVKPLDQQMAFRAGGMYQLVWSDVLDLIPYRLLETIFIKPGALVVLQSVEIGVDPRIVGTLINAPFAHHMVSHFSLYGVEAVSYTEKVVLDRLLSSLRESCPVLPLRDMEDAWRGMVDDIFEAYPYLILDTVDQMYPFEIQAVERFGGLTFSGHGGMAQFVFSDFALTESVGSTVFGGGLSVNWDGKLSFYLHPWRTLEQVYGYEDSLRLSCWLLEQVHGRLVSHYLHAEPIYRDRLKAQVETSDLGEADLAQQTAIYASWVKQAQETLPPEPEGDNAVNGRNNHSSIPQIRRNLFFKVLSNCGVTVEQGKGSEIKLLRHGRHPFRLGNHGYVNPTIPSFLAANILRRLEISHAEWKDALANA